MRPFLLILVSFFIINSLAASTAVTYKTTILVGNDVELTFEVYDVITGCQTEYYHYGERFNITSRSLTNKPYNITFNPYFFSTLGKGEHNFGGTYTVSSANPNLTNVTTQQNGKEVNYTSIGGKQNLSENLWCENLMLSDIGLNNIRIVYWGTYGGNTTGNFQSTLPVELTDFSAVSKANSVILNWSTRSERNNHLFTLERSSDGISFETIAILKGAGVSSKENLYSYNDQHLPSGVYYYRLKQTDFNGESEIFNVISIAIAPVAPKISVYPNPSTDGYFTIRSTETISGEMVIYNSLGQKVISQTLNNTSISNFYLPSENGVYFLEINADTTLQSTQEKLMLTR